jgi:hypothetical protein
MAIYYAHHGRWLEKVPAETVREILSDLQV